jgi:hypothetical protein
MQGNRIYFRFFLLKFLAFLVLSIGSASASAYTMQDLLDADRAIMDANAALASVQNEYPSLAAEGVRIEEVARENVKNCQNPNAHPDAVRECFQFANDEYERMYQEMQDRWNQYWFTLADAEVAVTNAISAYNIIYDAIYGTTS